MANIASIGGGPPALRAEVLLLLVAAVWGASYGLAKSAVAFYPVLGFLAVRFCITSALLLPSWRALSRAQVKATLKVGLPLGLLLMAIFVSETYGVSLTLASNAAFLISLCVVLTPFVEWAVLGARPRLASLVAAGVSLAGTWLLTRSGSISLTLGLGDLLMLVAALLRAVMMTLTARVLRGRDTPALALTSVQTSVVGVGCLLLGMVTLPGGLPPLPRSPFFWQATAFLVVFCTLLAFFVQNYALRSASPSRVSLLMGSEPVFGALFAVWWLHESLGPGGWLGGSMIVGASLWATRRAA